MSRLDRIDFEILRILQKNSRTSISEIAKILDLSRPTVRKRIKKLMDSGVIKRFTVVVDDSLVEGIEVVFSFKANNLEDLVNKLKDMDEFIEIYVTSGEKNLVGRANFPNMKRFREVMNQFVELNIPFEANLVIKRIKDSFDYIPSLLFKLMCDYCGKEIESTPLTFTIYNREFYFCCPTCLRDFRRMREEE
jgi:DNA-binding Lrp family transcriptional regulator